MNVIIILAIMIFLHIVDDFYLQGCLAKMKQKIWWEQQEGYNEKYRYDYVISLLMHSYSWSFVISLPFLVLMLYNHDFSSSGMYITVLILNTFMHYCTDNLKANLYKINLVQDQIIHLIQIIFTFLTLAPFNL